MLRDKSEHLPPIVTFSTCGEQLSGGTPNAQAPGTSRLLTDMTQTHVMSDMRSSLTSSAIPGVAVKTDEAT